MAESEEGAADAAPGDDERYKAAKKRVEDVKGFYSHLFVYLCVNTGLFLINLFTTGADGPWWFQWPLMGWGIGLVIHGLSVFVFEGRWLGPEWERRQIEKLMQDDRGSRGGPPASS